MMAAFRVVSNEVSIRIPSDTHQKERQMTLGNPVEFGAAAVSRGGGYAGIQIQRNFFFRRLSDWKLQWFQFALQCRIAATCHCPSSVKGLVDAATAVEVACCLRIGRRIQAAALSDSAAASAFRVFT